MKQRQLEATIMDIIQCRTLDLVDVTATVCPPSRGRQAAELRTQRRTPFPASAPWGKPLVDVGWQNTSRLRLGNCMGVYFGGLTCAAVIRQKLVAGVEELYDYLSFKTCMLLRLKMISIFSEVQAKLVESLQYILLINCFFWYTGSLLQPRMGKRREHKEGFWSCTSKDFPTIVTYQRESNSING